MMVEHGNLVSIAIKGACAYFILLFFLRISGKRTLSKLNAFDFIVTIALGSVLATVVLNGSVTLADGSVAFALLVGLQFAVTWLSVRFNWIHKTVTGEPAVLLSKGKLSATALKASRVTADDVRAAVRSSGLGGFDRVEAVVLETDGSLSVIPADSAGDGSALDRVASPPAR